ncbi:MAG: lytic transglycosylase domain-containing protein [Acidobacteria bacterium]|nr:lytic transglycosylase domain-containing protein [Acidobacteriota bacterium]
MASESRRRLMRRISLLSLALLAAASARADLALLTNGMRLRVERQEQQGDSLRLYVAGGYVDVAPSDIQAWEKDEAKPPAPKPANPIAASDDLPSLLSSAGSRQGLDPALLRSMIAEESNFHVDAVSRKGARGLMQLMPKTGELLGVKDLFSPGENIHGGAHYVRWLLERYKGDLVKALAAYNAGPAAVDRYRGIPPFAETQNYVRRVIARFNREKTKTKN